MNYIIWIISYIFYAQIVLANTETYNFQIPYYYDIPSSSSSNNNNIIIHKLNDSTTLIEGYPILDKYDYTPLINQLNSNITSIINLDYDTTNKPSKQLLIKLNNNKLSSNDLINVKLCWPSILPFNFDINHEFIKKSSLINNIPKNNDTLDIYLIINYKADFITSNLKLFTKINDHVYFNLFIIKLPNNFLPIPIELYDYIIYIIDLLIIFIPLLPKIIKFVFSC